MPASLSFDAYGEGLGDATAVLRNNAAAAGLGILVPTCPGWNLTDLIVHQGVVHRWATSCLLGETFHEASVEATGRSAPDLLEWLDDGVVDLLNALVRPAEGLAPFFLRDASPIPGEGWARRQCHETTIHAVDAMAARLGRAPAQAELWFPPTFAADGIDELVLGFMPRANTRLRFGRPARLVVIASDLDQSWTIDGTPDAPPITAPGGQGNADLTLTGTARALYLGLWNRGSEFAVEGDVELLDDYRRSMRVLWH